MEPLIKCPCALAPAISPNYQISFLKHTLDQIEEPIVLVDNREEYFSNASFRTKFGTVHSVHPDDSNISFERAFSLAACCSKMNRQLQEEITVPTVDGKIATVIAEATPFQINVISIIFKQIKIENERSQTPPLDTSSATEIDFLREFFDNASLLMGVAEILGDYEDVKFTLVNPKFAQYFGTRRNIPPTEVEGQLASALMDKNEMGIVLMKAKHNIPNCKFEFFPTDPNPAHCLLVNVIKSRPSTFSFIAQDITRYKEMELNYNNSQEKSCLDRRFLAIMSHEIRTCLSGIFAALAEFSNPELGTKNSELVQMGKDSGEQLRVVINDILDFAKIEENKLQLEKKEFGIHDTIDGLLDAASAEILNKKIEIICDIDDDLSNRLIGDRIRLRQVLLNLLSNAIKFSKESSDVELEISPDKTKQNFVHFSVRDHGIGINEEVKNTLFLPFAQAKVSTARKFGGSGLGLMICKKLVK